MRCWGLFLYQVAWHYIVNVIEHLVAIFNGTPLFPYHDVLDMPPGIPQLQTKLPRPIAVLGIFGGLISGLLGALLMTILAWWPQGVTLVAPTDQMPLHLTSAKIC